MISGAFLLLDLYAALMRLFTPLLARYLAARARRGKEDIPRAPERRGIAALPRPAGTLVWCHAASVGESLSLLAVVARILQDDPDAHVLMTTGTVTSAKLMAARLPPRAFHQYVPVDHPVWAARFIDYWQPDLVVWSESELWPNLLLAVQKKGIPAVLLNARMSERSFARWKMLPRTARRLLSVFDTCLGQNEAEAARLKALGARHVAVAGNLKYAALPLPCDPAKLDALRAAIGNRPHQFWASTHPGEEALALNVHQAMRAQYPDYMTIIVPRHPERGGDIALLAGESVQVRQRSKNEAPDSACGVYIADTLGELGIFYTLCDTVVMGGSFADVGGHNPIEPAQLDCLVVCGPNMYNFKGICADFDARHALVHTGGTAAEIAAKLQQIAADPAAFAMVRASALAWTQEKSYILDDLSQALAPYTGRGAAALVHQGAAALIDQAAAARSVEKTSGAAR